MSQGSVSAWEWPAPAGLTWGVPGQARTSHASPLGQGGAPTGVVLELQEVDSGTWGGMGVGEGPRRLPDPRVQAPVLLQTERL